MSDFVTIDQEKYNAVLLKLRYFASTHQYVDTKLPTINQQVTDHVKDMDADQQSFAAYNMGHCDGHRIMAQEILKDLGEAQ